jgi:hypothetical protein
MSLRRFFKKVSTNKLDRSQSDSQIVQNGEQIRRTSSPELINKSDGLPSPAPTGPKSYTMPVIQAPNNSGKSLPAEKENELPPIPDLYVNVAQDRMSLARSLPPSPVEKVLSSGNDDQLLSPRKIAGISVEPHFTRAEETMDNVCA